MPVRTAYSVLACEKALLAIMNAIIPKLQTFCLNSILAHLYKTNEQRTYVYSHNSLSYLTLSDFIRSIPDGVQKVILAENGSKNAKKINELVINHAFKTVLGFRLIYTVSQAGTVDFLWSHSNSSVNLQRRKICVLE